MSATLKLIDFKNLIITHQKVSKTVGIYMH